MKSLASPTIPRRQFLVQAGLGVASVATLSRALAQGSAANSRLRLGLIGCGARGQMLLELFAENGGYELTAAADYFADRVQEVAAKFGLQENRTFTGLQCAAKMIADGGLDAVAIASPPYFHPEQARRAIDAGLHVYLAKPVAVDVPGCNAILECGELARRKKLVFLVDFQTRANEFFLEAMRRVHAGAIGDICLGESSYHAGRLAIKAPPGTPEARLRNWVFDQELSGDIIVEQNVHTLDVMSWSMKETPPLRCTGTGGRRVRVDVGDAWDHYALVYEYPGQVGVTFSSRQFDGHGLTNTILNRMFGTKGILMTAYGGDVLIRGGAENFYRGGSTTGIYKTGPAANIAAFREQVRGGETANSTVEPSVTSTLVAIMGRMATRARRTVTWPEVMNTQERNQPDLDGLTA